MKYVVSALKNGSVHAFGSKEEAYLFMLGCFQKMTYEANEQFVLIETKGK